MWILRSWYRSIPISSGCSSRLVKTTMSPQAPRPLEAVQSSLMSEYSSWIEVAGLNKGNHGDDQQQGIPRILGKSCLIVFSLDWPPTPSTVGQVWLTYRRSVMSVGHKMPVPSAWLVSFYPSHHPTIPEDLPTMSLRHAYMYACLSFWMIHPFQSIGFACFQKLR